MAKIVFMGTPVFALPSLKGLIAAHDVLAAVTQPDRPAGRSSALTESPVKQLALAAGIPILQPKRLRELTALEALREYNADLFVVVAFGQILPQSVLDLPRFGTVNVHASLLPRWRGAAPIQAAIRAGDAESGVTIMLLDAGLDTGPLLAQRKVAVSSRETGQSLHDRLSVAGSELLLDTLPGYLSGDCAPQPQDDRLSTYAPQIRKVDGALDWSQPAEVIDRLARAYTPWPGTHTQWGSQGLKIISGRITEGMAEPGEVVIRDGAIAIGTGAGLYLPDELQLAGKKRLCIADFVNGHQDFLGARLGAPGAHQPSNR